MAHEELTARREEMFSYQARVIHEVQTRARDRCSHLANLLKLTFNFKKKNYEITKKKRKTGFLQHKRQGRFEIKPA